MEKFGVTTELQEETKTLLVKISGDIETAENIQEMRNDIDEKLWTDNINKLAFDLSDALPSDVLLGFLVGRYKKAHKQGIKVTIGEVSERMDRVLNLSGLYELMPKEDNGEATN